MMLYCGASDTMKFTDRKRWHSQEEKALWVYWTMSIQAVMIADFGRSAICSEMEPDPCYCIVMDSTTYRSVPWDACRVVAMPRLLTVTLPPE